MHIIPMFFVIFYTFNIDNSVFLIVFITFALKLQNYINKSQKRWNLNVTY